MTLATNARRALKNKFKKDIDKLKKVYYNIFTKEKGEEKNVP